MAGEHLRKYLEPVLRKCEQDRVRLGKEGAKDSALEISDTEEGRTRNNSVTESVSESEAELPSSATTPLTPTSRKDSDPFIAPSATKLYPFSSLHILSPATLSSEPTSSPSVSSSPGFVTPLSIDSGISVRTNSIQSPSERMKFARPDPLPPLPPEENAPPLPPQEQDCEVPPPPLPPLPPTPATDQNGIENISSDEDDAPTGTTQRTEQKKGFKMEIDLLSPVSVSPPSSPKLPPSTNLTYSADQAASTATFPVSTQFDPSLGLQNLLLGNQAPPPSATGDTSTPQDRTLSTAQYIAISPTPAPPPSTGAGGMNYELEVEEISGDESPVMVFNFDGIEVESVSEDGAGDDMEVCSDDDDAQDTLIEVNVRAVGPAGPDVYPQAGPPQAMLGLSADPRLRPPLPPAFPPGAPRVHLPPPPHPNFFPPHHGPPPPPHSAFPPPMPPHPPPVPPPFVPHPHPHAMIQPPFDLPPHSNYTPRLPNGFIDYPNRPKFGGDLRGSAKSKRPSFPSPSPVTGKESISLEVLRKAVEQLKVILLNDVQKKLVESYAYCALDNWERSEKEVSGLACYHIWSRETRPLRTAPLDCVYL